MKKLLVLIQAMLITCFLTTVSAQETTSTLTGRVSDSKGAILPGAIISVKHEPTGFTSNTQSNNKGIFVLPNLKPGGPYTIKISSLGFKAVTYTDINLVLGTNPDVDVTLLTTSTELKEVVVTAAGKKTIAGATVVGGRQLNTLPSIGRSLSDFTRLTPQSNNNSFAGSNFRYNNLTVDGAINNDAIGFSNSFGGVSGGGQSGAAGAGTRTNPYSLDVIQEVQVQIAPYDAKLGNFTGGSVNAVTKSGTNNFHGSVYAFGRNQTLMGKSVDGQKKSIGSDFYDYQYGATVSGPIMKNKAFFIVNFEQTRRQEPTFYNAGDPGAAVDVATAQSIRNNLLNKYNYDIGSYNQGKIFTNSDKLFARLDFNLDPKNTLMFRMIYTNGWGNNLERTTSNFQFSSTDFTQHTQNLNLVAELKTKISKDVNNQFNVSYINVHEYRDFPTPLNSTGQPLGISAAPFMDIGSGAIWGGTWREASIYNMKQQTFEISDNVTITKGINKITFGTHNEFYNLNYGFINSWNGRWEYSNLGNFLNDKPSRIRAGFSTDPKIPNDRNTIYNNTPNPFTVALLSAYGQDELSLTKRFKLTVGLRVDYSYVGNQPYTDTALKTTNTPAYVPTTNPTTYSNTPFAQLNNQWLGKVNLSPRIGFNWDINGDQSVVLRGGSGIFVGRIPFAWLGYAYTLSGGTYGNIDWKPASGTVVPLVTNPTNLPTTITSGKGREVDIVDNNFKLPSIIRSNIAADFKFGKGYKLTLDAMYTKTLYDVKFQQINVKDQTEYFTPGYTQGGNQSSVGAPNLTPVYVGGNQNGWNGTNAATVNQYTNVFLLTNTTEGYRYNLTAQISKVTNGLKFGTHDMSINWSAAYTYGESKDLSNGIRNSFQSNFELNPSVVPNNPQLAYSNFDLRHRIVATAGFNVNWNSTNSTSVSFFYSGQSGSPYSVTYAFSGSLQYLQSGNTPFSNKSNAALPYIPNGSGDIILADVKDANGNVTYTAAQQRQDLDNFINGDKYLRTRKGQYAERNGLHTPWNHDLDMKIMHEFKLSRTDKSKALQISFDVFNLLNLLDNTLGHITFVTNVNNYTVNMLAFVPDANGKAIGKPSSGYTPTFNFIKPAGLDGHYYTVDPINSRWQGQVGVKYIF